MPRVSRRARALRYIQRDVASMAAASRARTTSASDAAPAARISCHSPSSRSAQSPRGAAAGPVGGAEVVLRIGKALGLNRLDQRIGVVAARLLCLERGAAGAH